VHQRIRDTDVEEGLLICDQCSALFPILGGILLWLPDSRTYLLRRYVEVQSLIAENGLLISDQLRQFMQGFAPASQAIGFTPASWESDAGIQVYKRAQYSSIFPKAESSAGLTTFQSTPGYRDFYERCLDIVGARCKMHHHAVDIGCGVGGFTYRLSKLFSNVLGLDYSLKAVSTARQLTESYANPSLVTPERSYPNTPVITSATTGKIDIITGDITSLPLRTGTFDLAVSLNLIDVLPEPEQLISASAKALSQGGLFLLSTCFYWRVDRSACRNWLLTATDVERCLVTHGFRVLEHHERIPWLLPMSERYTQVWDADIFLAQRDISL
jgi:SAM-dependent methyltransferase